LRFLIALKQNMVALHSAHAGNSVKSVSLESIDEVLRQLGPGPNRQATMETIRQAVLRDTDMKINRQSEEMWKKGKLMLKEMELKHRQMTTQFAEAVTKVQDKQRALEAENALLKQSLARFSDQVSKVGPLLSSDLDESCGQMPSHFHNFPESHPCGKMPDVPEFPFPTQAAPVLEGATPLSLASALSAPAPPAEALVRQKTPLSLMETLAPPTILPLPLIPAHPLGDGSSFCFPDGSEFPSPECSPTWCQVQISQVGSAPSNSQIGETFDEQHLCDLATLPGGCPPQHAPPGFSPSRTRLYAFAMSGDASVFVPSVSVGIA